jgi:DNA-binding SARP family transcriptional activator
VLRDGEHDDLLRSSVDWLRHARVDRYPFSIRPPPVPLEFRILGPLEVLGPDGPVHLGGPRQRAVLAILLLNANRVVSIDRLADELYDGEPPATAVTQVQRQVSDLRKLIGPAIETRAPGYVVRAGPEGLDLTRYERLSEDAASALSHGERARAAALLREALALWRGAPLADLAYEAFAAAPVARLEELRLTGLEQRIEAELALGEHRRLVAELEALVAEHPTHERFSAQLMLALYRSGRQEDALAAYRSLRRALVEQFGIEPTPELARLEQAVLNQDPSLDAPAAAPPAPERGSVLVCGRSAEGVERAAGLAAPLGRDLLAIELLDSESELAAATTRLAHLRSSLARGARAAAFVSSDWAQDVSRLAATYDVELLVVADTEGRLPAELLERSPADVALLTGLAARPGRGDVLVGFGGSEHDWAAVELAAWLAQSSGRSLKLLALRRTAATEPADATRLLAAASIAVQGAIGIDAEPLLLEPGPEAMMAAARGAHALVLGLSPRWRTRGLGSMRSALVEAVEAPMLLVHRGPRPGGLAPAVFRTRFTWSLG